MNVFQGAVTQFPWSLDVGSDPPVEQASACLHLNFAALAMFKTKQAEQAAEKVGGFVGRGFNHDVSALDSSGVYP